MSLRQEGTWDFDDVAKVCIKIRRLHRLAKQIWSPACIVTQEQLDFARLEFSALLNELLETERDAFLTEREEN